MAKQLKRTSTTTSQDRRTAFEDLPPDRQAEIIGNKQARSDRRRNTYRPKAPAIMAPIEIHTAEIQLAYVKWFAACNEYAVAIDYVARERLDNRADYNRYLQEFDDALSLLSNVTLELFTQYEEASNGGMAASPMPSRIDARIQSKRSMQLLQLFKRCDDVLRMISFLEIYGNVPEAQVRSDFGRVVNSLNTCLKALRKVKVACFKQIIDAEALSAKSADRMTIQDLEAARKLASRKETGPRKPVRKRKPKAIGEIDPAASASSELLVNPEDVDRDTVRKADMNKGEGDEAVNESLHKPIRPGIISEQAPAESCEGPDETPDDVRRTGQLI
ncbi:hypothetical protein Q4511_15615 [Paracoccus sp. 1_MG-2023]|uniref:hypothetical protein n=1 Tax=unclassified Paracoccus (in: a-proteobacteria) TaxID=2688777 RepID=UPI001C0A54FA|nr:MULTISPECIES: hypothetical protein [unclassified Paracoccus (in: a-proteobacteria)]MBU2958020.1 hypothetical protein [Paracoccus sp. C2R09]MDO6670345.1 hypothetical protein [Paracoccus sp. 1_MG-2023]